MTIGIVRRVGSVVDAVELFGGFGGTAQGVHAAGAEVRVAANHLPIATECYAKNFPHVDVRRADLVDLDAADYIDPADLPPARLLVASPSCRFHSRANAKKVYLSGLQDALPGLEDDFDHDAYANSERSRVTMLCFSGETLVLTDQGLVPIKDVRVGDNVLTHRNRWRSVVATASRKADTIRVKGRGHYGIECTPEHPFYVRANGMIREGRIPKRVLGQPEWRAAADLDSVQSGVYHGRFDGWFWATPAAIPALPVPAVPGPRELEQDERFWYLVGRWLGDGCCRFTSEGRGRTLDLACARSEADELRSRVAFADLRWTTKDQGRSAVVLETCHKSLVEWLNEHFGRYAHGKHIPAWVFGMPRPHRAALLDGYVAADGRTVRRGSTNNRWCTASTVSRELAFGLRLLVESLGYGASVSTNHRPVGEIEGRTIRRRRSYQIHWGEVSIHPRTVYSGGHRWSRIRRTEPGRSNIDVFDIEVEEDHSFVADGVVVHNCPLRYAARHHPELVMIENVIDACFWGPDRDGSTFRWWLREWDKLGYDHELLFLDSAHFPPCPQHRERLYVCLWLKGNPRPDLDYRPRALCTSDRCGGATVDAERQWKPRKPTWPLERWGEYRRQYVYVCPSCREPVEPLSWPAYSAIDFSNLGPTIGQRADAGRPLAATTVERVRRTLVRFGGSPPVIVPAKALWGTDLPVTEPLATQTAQQDKALVVSGVVVPLRQNGGRRRRAPDGPMWGGDPSVSALACVPSLVEMRGGGSVVSGQRHVADPMHTVTAGGMHHGLVVPPALFAKINGGPGDTAWHNVLSDPLNTVTARDTHGLVILPWLEQWRSDPAAITDQLATVMTHLRHSLCTAPVGDAAAAADLADVHFRMLEPHELKIAMSFEDSFVLVGNKRQQVAGLGNAVTPPVATWVIKQMLATLDLQAAA